MRIYFFHVISFLLLHSSLYGMESGWLDLFEQYNDVINSTPIISAQYQAFMDNNVPSPSDPRLKSIPIDKCAAKYNEKLVDIKKTGQNSSARVYMMKDPAYPAEGPEYNSGLPNNSLVRQTVASKLSTMVHHLDTLSPQFGYENGSIDIQVCDALRNEDVQVFLFNLTCQQTSAAFPTLTQEEVYQQVARVASPPGAPYIHPSGAAADIRLWHNKEKKFLDMGDFGVPWTKDHSTFPTFANHITEKQKINRLLSVIAAAKAGLTNYPGEYWHFSYGDCMNAYWKNLNNTEKATAVYDLVEQGHLAISIDENGHFKVTPLTEEEK